MSLYLRSCTFLSILFNALITAKLVTIMSSITIGLILPAGLELVPRASFLELSATISQLRGTGYAWRCTYDEPASGPRSPEKRTRDASQWARLYFSPFLPLLFLSPSPFLFLFPAFYAFPCGFVVGLRTRRYIGKSNEKCMWVPQNISGGISKCLLSNRSSLVERISTKILL